MTDRKPMTPERLKLIEWHWVMRGRSPDDERNWISMMDGETYFLLREVDHLTAENARLRKALGEADEILRGVLRQAGHTFMSAYEDAEQFTMARWNRDRQEFDFPPLPRVLATPGCAICTGDDRDAGYRAGCDACGWRETAESRAIQQDKGWALFYCPACWGDDPTAANDEVEVCYGHDCACIDAALSAGKGEV